MRRTRVPETCKFPRRNHVFLQKWLFRAGPRGGGGPPGVGGRGGIFRGFKNAKKWEEIVLFGMSDWKFPIETLFFYLGAFPAGPPNFFCPTWFCDFCARSHQSRAFENDPSQKSVDDENEGTFIKHRFPAGFSCEAWVSGGAKRQKMGRNRLFRDLRLEISNRSAVFQSWGLPGRTSELFLPHLVLRFSRSGAPKQRVQKPWHPWLLSPCKRLVHSPVALTW